MVLIPSVFLPRRHGQGEGREGGVQFALIILSLFAVEPLSFDTMIAAFHGDFHRDRPET